MFLSNHILITGNYFFFRGLLRGMLILAVIIKLPNAATKDLLVFC